MATALNIGEHVLGRDALAGLLGPLRPTATVYLPAPSDRTDADQRLELQWKDAARALSREGAAPADVDAIAGVVEGGHRGGEAIVAVAAGGAVQACGFLDQPVARPLTTVSPLPALLPLLAWDQARVPHVLVVADRVGADVIAVSPTERDRSLTVEGDDLHIHRGAPGGWSQRRFQQRAENQWESNAADVAERVISLVDDIDAEAVVVAGDERAVGFLREHLPSRVDELVRPIPGARAEWSEDRIADETIRQVADTAAESLMADLEGFGDAIASRRAVDGPQAVCEALRRARIDRLYVADDTDETERVSGWTAEDPAFLFPGPGRPDVDVDVVKVPLHDAAVRAAVLTGAEVVVVPVHGRHSPTGGLGGLLRGTR